MRIDVNDYLIRNYATHTMIVVFVVLTCLFCLIILSAIAFLTSKRDKRRICLKFMLFSIVGATLSIVFNRIVLNKVMFPYVQKRSQESLVLQTGMTAPAYTIETIDGRSILIGPQQTKVVVLDFFATWCGPCRAELPQLQQFFNSIRNKYDLDIVVVGREQNERELSDFKNAEGYSLDFASDPHGELFHLFFREGIPRTVVIGPGGKIASIYTLPKYLAAVIDSINH